MAKVYLGIGSNIDPEDKLRLAIRGLRQRFGDLDMSDVYRSAAVGFAGPDFLNLVVALDTDTPALEVWREIETIHNLAGRQRSGEPYTSRPLDIDLLLYDEMVCDERPLRLPRSDILEYGFVLRPLAELAPKLVHPVTGRTMADHWRSFDQRSHPLTRVDLAL